MEQKAGKTLHVGGNSSSIWFKKKITLTTMSFKRLSGFKHYIIPRASDWLADWRLSLSTLSQSSACTDSGTTSSLFCVLALSIWAEISRRLLSANPPPPLKCSVRRVSKKLFQMALLLCNCKNSITERNLSIKAFGKIESIKPL